MDSDHNLPADSPSVFGMAASASTAVVRFAASGFRTAASEEHQLRVAQCMDCQHRSGSRCRVCGCFFEKKAWLPLEDCPIGRWPT